MESNASENKKSTRGLAACVLFAGLFVGIAVVYSTGKKTLPETLQAPETPKTVSAETVPFLPDSVELPVVWSDLGTQMITAGVIDRKAVEDLYADRGGLTVEMKLLLDGTSNQRLKISAQNAPFILNLLWGIGLGNKNSILEKGPMTDPAYGGAGGFASTGGWTLARGDAMQHYSKHIFVSLTAFQQTMIERVSKNIYRPCCDNSTYFPDCNHGMAMLGLLELMASQGASEKEMYAAALAVNAYWFPTHYETIARYLSSTVVSLQNIDPSVLLGAEYSSISGFRKIAAKVPQKPLGGGGCGI